MDQVLILRINSNYENMGDGKFFFGLENGRHLGGGYRNAAAWKQCLECWVHSEQRVQHKYKEKNKNSGQGPETDVARA